MKIIDELNNTVNSSLFSRFNERGS